MSRAPFPHLVATSLLAASALAGTAAAQPAQYSKDDVIKAFSAPPAAAPAAPAGPAAPSDGDACPPGTAMGDDGLCAPVMQTRGFSLVDPKHVAAGRKSAAPARTAAVAPARPVRRPAPRLASTAVSSGDLLITFRTGSAELTGQGRANARVFASALNSPALAGARFEIAGHTDSQGAAAKNMSLSQARAESVRRELVQDGVDGGRLMAKGYGAAQPVAGVDPAAPANRRVEAHRLDAAG